jgi:2-hydroxy-3-keto-5-methylthiopentenyl-1-phosphate phosphatase
VLIASAGCRWYIERLLGAEAGRVTIHANPGRLEAGRLAMEREVGAPFHCPDAGVDKAAIVRSYLEQGRVVAYAGDGLTDLPPARLVGAGQRFARGSLAARLAAEGLAFQPFERFADVTRGLLPPA